MIQQQIENFTRSLTDLATQYSDPSVILQHIPVLKNNLMFQQNPEYLLYGAGGLVAMLYGVKRLKKSRKNRIKNVGLIMPQPYLGDADGSLTHETTPASNDTNDFDDDFSIIPEAAPVPSPKTRSLEEQLHDVSAIRFAACPALAPDEARTRVVVQSVLNEFGAGYNIMARTALSAILQPVSDAIGPERAQAIAALQDKYLDFGVFDRAGRCIVALQVDGNASALGHDALQKSVVRQALAQAQIPLAVVSPQDTPADIRAKIGGYFAATARPQPTATTRSERATRVVRPARPVRAAAIANG